MLVVSESLRGLSSLSRVDYADVFTVATTEERTPEQWARRMFGDAPGIAGTVIWRGLLGLRLERSPARVAGWRIAEQGVDWIRLEAESWFLSANLVIVARDRCLSFATFMRYDRAFARLVWSPLSAVHRALAPDLLDGAVGQR